MSIQEVSAERFAQLFHHYHLALADESENAAQARTCDAWADVPPPEKAGWLPPHVSPCSK